MALSLLFVLIMAALDLLIPYLTKEAIDRYIVVAAREVVLKEMAHQRNNASGINMVRSSFLKKRKGNFFFHRMYCDPWIGKR